MPYFRLTLSCLHLPCSQGSSMSLWPTLSYVVDYTCMQSNLVLADYHSPVMKSSIFPSYACVTSTPKFRFGALQINVDVERSGFGKYFQPKLDLGSVDKLIFDEEVQLNSYHESHGNTSDPKEMVSIRRRKRKKKHGNKGKVPWNKGIKHTKETCALIKQRTIEALKDPQVRKKMSEHPLPHSVENKEKISSSLRQIWAKRLKWKRQREKFFLLWGNSIAKAAKEGGRNQQELDWKSCDKIEQMQQCVTDKEKAKEQAKITVEKAKEEEQLEKAKTEVKKKTHRKSKNNMEEMAVAQQLTLKKRLSKIHKSKLINGQLMIRDEGLVSHSPAWQKLDLELMKTEKVKREVSLADQIQAAKNKRAESIASKASALSTVLIFAGRSVE